MTGRSSSPEMFVSYAHEDKDILENLEPHLALLVRQEKIRLWHDGEILAGADWEHEITQRLESADIILLLVSANFIASEYCWGVEMRRAIERHGLGEARVIPLIVRPCLWESAPFAGLQSLPRGAKAVTLWDDRDEALRDVASGIAQVAETMARSE